MGTLIGTLSSVREGDQTEKDRSPIRFVSIEGLSLMLTDEKVTLPSVGAVVVADFIVDWSKGRPRHFLRACASAFAGAAAGD